MGNLNPNIPSAELARLMTGAADSRNEFKLQLLTPQLLLYEFLNKKESAAYQILQRLHEQRGADLNDLVRRVEMMAHSNKGHDASFNFTDDFGRNVPLDEEMLVVLDEGFSIAQAREELKAGSGHALAAMTQPNVTTSAVLQRAGVSTAAVTSLLDEISTEQKETIIRDYVQEAKEGRATAVLPARAAAARSLYAAFPFGQTPRDPGW